MGKITKRSSDGVRRGSGTVNATWPPETSVAFGAAPPTAPSGSVGRLAGSTGGLAALSAGLVVGVLRPRLPRLALVGREGFCDVFVSWTVDCAGASGIAVSDIVLFGEKTCAILELPWGHWLRLSAVTIFYLAISQMSIPPWIVAFMILVVVAAFGAHRLGVNYGLPEGFGSDHDPSLTQSLGSRAERQSQGTNDSEGFVAPPNSRTQIVPEYKKLQQDPYLYEPIGLHDRQIQPTGTRGVKDSIFGVKSEGFEDRKLYPGIDQNITVAQQPVAYSGIADNETTSPLTSQLAQVQAVAKGTIPDDQNLTLIGGGSQEAANVQLSTAYQPHQEKIYPDQHPRPSYTQLTAGAPTDTGTQAEEIQKASVRTPSVRELVREEQRRESESFNNPYGVRYQKV